MHVISEVPLVFSHKLLGSSWLHAFGYVGQEM